MVRGSIGSVCACFVASASAVRRVLPPNPTNDRARESARHAVDAGGAGISRHRRAGLPAGRRAHRRARAAAARRSSRPSVAAETLARLPTAVVLDLDETVLDNTVLPGAAAARPRPSTTRRPGASGWARARRKPCPARASSSPGRARSATRCSTSPIATARRRRPPPTDPCPAKTATMRNLVALGIDAAPDPAAHAAARRTPGMEQQQQDAAPRIHRR